MSSNKAQKWSSSSSLTKILTRISRTLSFSSKKSQRTFKTNTKKIKPTESVVKNVNFAPQSVPILRRQVVQPLLKVPFIEKIRTEKDIDEDDEDYSRYSLRPNLSLFNISAENLYFQSPEDTQQIPQPRDWLDEIFHSTKIEDY